MDINTLILIVCGIIAVIVVVRLFQPRDPVKDTFSWLDAMERMGREQAAKTFGEYYGLVQAGKLAKDFGKVGNAVNARLKNTLAEAGVTTPEKSSE